MRPAMKILFNSTAIASAILAVPAWAQASDPVPANPASTKPEPASVDQATAEDQVQSSDGDIVVTANRRSERLSKVPISVSALSLETLDQRGIRSAADLQRTVPGVVFDATLGSIAIRGVASNAGASTTGTYIDDTPIQLLNLGTHALSAVPALYDLERVEVLRGPQGTLFGAGAQGGVVRYITPQPELSGTSGYAQAEVGFIEGGSVDYQTNAAIGTALVEDKLGVRVSGFYRRIGGWIDRLDYRNYSLLERNYNKGEVYGGKLAFKFAPVENLEITPAFMMQIRRGTGDDMAGLNGYSEFQSDPAKGVFNYAKARPILFKDDWYLPSLKVQLSLGGVDVISNTSYFYRKEQDGSSAADFFVSVYNNFPELFLPGVAPLVTPAGIRLPINNYDPSAITYSRQKNFIQELRLQSNNPSARLTWVLGAYYQRNNGSNQEIDREPQQDDLTMAIFGFPGADFWGLPLINGDQSFNGTLTTTDEQFALFGQADFALTDKLKVIAGARVSHNKLGYTVVADGPLNAGPTPFTRLSQQETPFTPKVGLSYQIDPDNLVYATYAKGYRIGGVNAPVPSFCDAGFASLGVNGEPPSYSSDKTQSYELGSKNRLFGGKLQLATSAFYVKWKGIQQAITIPVCGYIYVDNLGQAESKGFDLQLQARPVKGLTIDASFGYTNAVFSRDVIQGSAVLARKGDTLGGPSFTFALGAQQDFTVGSMPSFLRVDWQHAGRPVGPLATQDPNVPNRYDPNLPLSPATDYLTARLGTKLDKVQLALFVDNLLNSSQRLERYHANSTWPSYTARTWRPRTISLIGTYRF